MLSQIVSILFGEKKKLCIQSINVAKAKSVTVKQKDSEDLWSSPKG